MKVNLKDSNLQITGKNKYNPIKVIPIIAKPSFAAKILLIFISLNGARKW